MKIKRSLVRLAVILGLSLGLFVATPSLAYGETVDPDATWEHVFPDTNFLQKVFDNLFLTSGPTSPSRPSPLAVIGDTNAQLISEATSLDVANAGISSLEGIQYFEALTILNCNLNQLTSLDVSANTNLVDLYCLSNQLTTLNVSTNTNLERLSCFNNQLTSLDVSGNPALFSLACNNNLLTSLDVSANPALGLLNCYNNQLTSLDISGSPALEYLSCFNNQLTTLDVSNNPALSSLECQGNSLLTITGLERQLNNFDASGQTLTILMVKNGSSGYISAYTYPIYANQTLVSDDLGVFDFDPVSMRFTAPNVPATKGFTTSFNALNLSPIKGTLTFAFSYLVTFESNGGSAVEPQAILPGEMVREPLPPTRTGDAFEGWYSDSALTQKWDFATPVNEDMTLYAKWSEHRTGRDGAGRDGAGSNGLANTGDNVLLAGCAALAILAGAGVLMLIARRRVAGR